MDVGFPRCSPSETGGWKKNIEMIIQLEYLDIYIALFHTNLERIIYSFLIVIILFTSICFLLVYVLYCMKRRGNRVPPLLYAFGLLYANQTAEIDQNEEKL